MSMFEKTLFGTGGAETYLVDTLNRISPPAKAKRTAAKCMSMISAARSKARSFQDLIDSEVMNVRLVCDLVRLARTEQSKLFAEQSKTLDEGLKAWELLLTDEGYVNKSAEILALKLAMNISTAALKKASVSAISTRMAEIRSARIRNSILRSKH